MTEPTQRKRRWTLWLLVAVLAFAALGVAGWFGAQGYVKSNIEAELVNLEFGDPKIGSVSVTTSGVKASDISFFRSPDDREPWLTLDELIISHPLRELVSGTEKYDGIELNAVRAVVDLQEADEEDAILKFDLSDFSLPSKSVQINDSSVVLRQSGKDDFVVDDLNVSLESVDDSPGGPIRVSGEAGDLAGGRWQVSGDITPDENEFQLQLATKSLQLENGQWQKLPYLPADLEDIVRADGQLAVQLELNSHATDGLGVTGTASIEELDLTFPTFDLPVQVQAGEIEFREQSLSYRNVEATVDGSGHLAGNGQTRMEDSATRSTFEARFRDVDIATWRKLASGIPEVARGQSTGDIAGSVVVERSTRTLIDITADAIASDASYDRITTESLNAEVRIRELTFDEQQNFESVGGSVKVFATSDSQPVERIFETFELQSLNRQLEIAGTAVADVELRLPLDTAGDVATWTLNVDGRLPAASIGGQPISDADVTARLERGELRLQPITAIPVLATRDGQPPAGDGSLPVSAAEPRLDVSVAWPLVEQPEFDSGRISVAGENVPTGWLTGLIQRLASNADAAAGAPAAGAASEPAFPGNMFPGLDLAGEPDARLAGHADLNASLTMPLDRSDQLRLWSGEGTIRNSTVVVQPHQLQDLNADLQLANGSLRFSELTGRFQHGGQLAGSGRVDLVENADHQIHLKTSGMPLPWVATLAVDTIPDLEQTLADLGLPPALTPEQIRQMDGELDADLRWETTDDDADTPWTIEAVVRADELRFGDEALRNLDVNGQGDSRQFQIEKLHAEFSDRGLVEASGHWDFVSETGNGTVQWRQLPVGLLARLAQIEAVELAGTTHGELRVKSPDPAGPGDAAATIEVRGSVMAEDFVVGGVRARPFEFDIATRESVVHIENFRTEDERIQLDLRGQMALQRPYAFGLDGDFGRLRLSRLLRQPSVTERAGETVALSGVLSGDFDFRGELQPLDWRTSGHLLVASPTLNGKQLDNISAEWNHVGNDWAQSRVVVKAFDGMVRLVELTSQPERVRVEISDVDALQLTSLLEMPVEFSGKLSGQASLNDWSLLDTRWADLQLRGSSMLIGPTEFGDFTAEAEFRKQRLAYEIGGSLLAGRLTGKGETELEQTAPWQTGFPFEITLTNASLNRLYGESNFFRSLRPLSGRLSATAALTLAWNNPTTGTGRIAVDDLKWSNEVLTRDASVRFVLNEGIVVFDDVRADLRRGSIAGQARIPLNPNIPGSYNIDVRRMDLERIMEVVSSRTIEVRGLFDARVSGQIGRQVSGQGMIGVKRASLHGLAGESIQLPVRFQLAPWNQSGRIELRRSTFRLFDGSVSGSATINFGTRLNVATDLKLANLDTGKLLASLADFDQADQGKLSGQFVLKGNGIRSARDLKGSFRGKLERAAAFKLPVLSDLANFLSGNAIRTRDYNSDEIDLRLDNGRVSVNNLNFFNPLAKVAITGYAWLDGRLDLNVAARVERLNQPTLLDELVGSPLVRLTGSPASFFAQAADFLSERVVFLNVGGTFRRPQVRIDTGRQLTEETIRYFLRGSQILPYDLRRNN